MPYPLVVTGENLLDRNKDTESQTGLEFTVAGQSMRATRHVQSLRKNRMEREKLQKDGVWISLTIIVRTDTSTQADLRLCGDP